MWFFDLLHVTALPALLLWGLFSLLRTIYLVVRPPRPVPETDGTLRTLVVLGSGGHTSEMCTALEPLDRTRYCPMLYVCARTDARSLEKALAMERAWSDANPNPPGENEAGQEDVPGQQAVAPPPPPGSGSDGKRRAVLPALEDRVEFETIPRAREVHQPWLSTIVSTAEATAHSIKLVWEWSPDIVFCNGPGTCVPVCLAALLSNIVRFWRPPCAVVFMESWCRVKALSMSGRLLYPFASLFLVHWPQLAERYSRATLLNNLFGPDPPQEEAGPASPPLSPMAPLDVQCTSPSCHEEGRGEPEYGESGEKWS